MRIGIDAMGGDFAPAECIKGVLLAAKTFSASNSIVLFGQEEKIKACFDNEKQVMPSFVEIVNCPDIIEMAESPTRGFAGKPNSSIAVGFAHLKEGKIDSFGSAGNTGAMLVGAMFSVKAIPGVLRPAIGAVLPRPNKKHGLLLDVGANADCRPDVLAQFGILGSLYVSHIYKTQNPRVALLNIGEEEDKGNKDAKEAYVELKKLAAAGDIDFVGNVEGRDIFTNDNADVIVTDGFTGNIVLKLGESLYDMFKHRINETDDYIDSFNYENYGGTGILGVNAPVIIAHGISNSVSFNNMINLSKQIIESHLVEDIKKAFQSVIAN